MVQSKSNPRVNRFSATSFILYSITFLLLLTTTCYHYYHSYNNQNQTNHITHHHNYIQPKESHSHSNSSSHSDSNSSSHLNSNTATHLNPNTSSHPVTQLHSKLKLKHIFHHSSNTFKQYSLSNSTNDDIHPISSSRHKLADSNTDLNTFEIPYKTQLSNPTLKLPDPTNSDTVLKLAQMTYNAYFEPSREDWRDVEGWNVSTEFGWENDGIRGYVFVDDEKDTLVITIKGTSARWIGGGTWKTFCDCKDSTLANTCSASCITKNVNFADSYYNLAQTIYLAVRSIYSSTTSIWVTGHSLGGSIAGLIGLTNGIPVFAYEGINLNFDEYSFFSFQAPGDMLYAKRIGLLPDYPSKPGSEPDYSEFMSKLPIYHFGNDGDPLFLGKCTGPSSTCYWGGYAMESKCHLGKVCTYELDKVPRMNGDMDTKGLDIRHHGIKFLIDNVLDKVANVPECKTEVDCHDCEQWTFSQ